MSGVLVRLDRLRDRFRPAGCGQGGPYCATAWHVRSDVDDPANPPPPGTCPNCGRPRLVRELVLAGVDATQI